MRKYTEIIEMFYGVEHLNEIIKYYEEKWYVIGYRAKDQEHSVVLYLSPKEIRNEKYNA